MCIRDRVNVLDNNQQIAACQSKLIDAQTGKVQSLGGLQGVYGGKSKIHEPKIDKQGIIRGIFYPVGAAVLIRRSVLLRCGGFDEKLFYGDVDLGWRLRLLGYDIVVNPFSKCYHYGSYATKKFVPSLQLSYHTFREKLRILLKVYSLQNLLKRICFWAAVSFSYAVYLSIKTKRPHIFSWVKAILWNLRNFSDTLSARNYIQRLRKISDNDVEKYMLSNPAEIYFWRSRLNEYK